MKFIQLITMPVWSFEPVVSVRGYLLCFLCAVFVAIPRLISADEALIELHYQIDRSQLPELNEYDLTLLISVGDANDIAIFDNSGYKVAFTHLPEEDLIVVTTEVDEFFVELLGVSEYENVGTVTKAPLKDNKKWVWSHAFDDNHFLEAPIDIMVKNNLPATMYVVGDWIDSGYAWEGDLTAGEIHELMNYGWSIGNHTAGHDNNCGLPPTKAERRTSILETDQVLREVIESSQNPEYKVLSFAVPCGGNDRFAAYNELILEMRDAQETNILFSEGGHEKPMHMSVEAPFNFNQSIKRDLKIDGDIDNKSEIMALFDSMHENEEAVWYNSFSHNEHLFGDNTQKLNDIATYFVNTYGEKGTNEAWMAPADVIYSYLLNRDLSSIQLVSDTIPDAPTSTPVSTSVPATPTPTPSGSVNQPPTPTPTPAGQISEGGEPKLPMVFLPLVTQK